MNPYSAMREYMNYYGITAYLTENVPGNVTGKYAVLSGNFGEECDISAEIFADRIAESLDAAWNFRENRIYTGSSCWIISPKGWRVIPGGVQVNFSCVHAVIV